MGPYADKSGSCSTRCQPEGAYLGAYPWVHGISDLLPMAKARGITQDLAKMQVKLTPMGDGFAWTSRDLDVTHAKALHGWEVAKERIASGAFDIFVLDEFTYLLYFGWLETAKVLAWIAAHKPPMLHLIITGRDAPRALIEAADLVTEMREIKHPLHTQGIRPRKACPCLVRPPTVGEEPCY
jgi:cob(I)alamin adenosyltransferase